MLTHVCLRALVPVTICRGVTYHTSHQQLRTACASFRMPSLSQTLVHRDLGKIVEDGQTMPQTIAGLHDRVQHQKEKKMRKNKKKHSGLLYNSRRKKGEKGRKPTSSWKKKAFGVLF